MAEVIDLLRETKVVIERDGWMHGVQGGGGKCLWLAMVVASQTVAPALNSDRISLRMDAVKVLGFTPTETDHAPVIDWNDTPGRTREEVLARIDEGIAACC